MTFPKEKRKIKSIYFISLYTRLLEQYAAISKITDPIVQVEKRLFTLNSEIN